MKPAADRSLRIDGESAATAEFRFDGRRVVGRPGESLASALWAAGIRTLGHSPGCAAPRGLFCNVGVCHQCVVVVDGLRRPACTTPVVAGLDVASIALDPDAGA